MQSETFLAERRAALLQAAAQVGRSVAAILDIDALLKQAVDIICDTYGFYYAGVFLIDASGEWAVLRAGRGEAGAAMIAAGHKLKVGGRSMIGTAVARRKALIALDVGEEPVHFKNPLLPDTRSEMALPLIAGDQVIGALTVQSVEEAAFSEDDITSLQAMADLLAVALNNARLLKELKAAHEELVRTKTYEAIATATIEAIHWIGNKALPISASVERIREDLEALAPADPQRAASIREDLTLIEGSAKLIVSVQEHLIGPAREEKPRPAMLEDIVKDAVALKGIPTAMVHYTIAPILPLVRADTTQLTRALGYILQNALEAMENAAEKRIEIEIAPTEDLRFVAVRIADTGPGIPEEEQDKIWAAFYTTKGTDHAGLGLTAALQILRQIDGYILTTNRPEGGALFELRVPVFEGTLPDPGRPGKRSVLLIDDDDAWSRFARAALKGFESVVSRSADGRTDPQPFDLILLDDVLHKADSLSILKRLVAAGVGERTVVVASSMRVERAMTLMQAGARDVRLKPYTAAELADLLEAYPKNPGS